VRCLRSMQLMWTATTQRARSSRESRYGMMKHACDKRCFGRQTHSQSQCQRNHNCYCAPPVHQHTHVCVFYLMFYILYMLFLQISAEVTELSEQLKAAAAEAEYINSQEKMFGWATTKYQNVAKVRTPCCCRQLPSRCSAVPILNLQVLLCLQVDAATAASPIRFGTTLEP
jgi:hypothetical protein